jgi:hypothetical protein
METQRNIERGELKDSKKSLSQCHFVYNKHHVDWPGANTSLSVERLGSNRLSVGTALSSSAYWRTVFVDFLSSGAEVRFMDFQT